MKVVKRDGAVVDFEVGKIVRAIEKAMQETTLGLDKPLSEAIGEQIVEASEKRDVPISVDEIQDMVEELLMESPRKDAAKKYIIYRNEKDSTRITRKKEDHRLLTDDFISKYKHMNSPMQQLGDFVYYRTYSRWLPEEKRREYWWETVRRAVEYNCTITKTNRSEAEELFDNIFHLRQFLSGRTFWVGGTSVAKHYPMANYNCSFQIVNNFSAFKDIFYLLMIGSGVGVRILKDDVSQLPRVRTDFEVVHKDYSPLSKSEREDNTSLEFFYNNTVKITIGDSKEGWVQSLDFFMQLIHSNEYRNIKTIIIDYDHVRPKGEKLRTFGGTASGHTSLKNMFYKIDRVVKKAGILTESKLVKLRPIDCLDIANVIGENVVVGGVRRTAEIVLVDADDQECIEAKSKLYTMEDGKWIVNEEILHRQMSNNSIYYKEKPTREKLKWQLERMRYSGEPGWVNEVAGAKRRPNFNGVNPCGEILLDNKGLCNLTTINVFAFVDENNKLDIQGLLKAQRLSARASYRMTCVELELPMWNNVQQRDKLLGCSLTGWMDMINATKLNKDEQANLLKMLRDAAKKEAEMYSAELGGGVPVLVTTVKPEGTLSQLPVVSSGVHHSHSPYYIRRVRINSHDPLVKVCEELGYPVLPEVGQELETCTTKVVEFPVKAPVGKTKYDVSAIEQLETYKMFMEHYVDHNCSITVSVRPEEWEIVEEWVYNNWDDTVALSFLPLEDSFYQLMPYEAISEEEYTKRVIEMKPFRPSLITKYEKEEVELDIGSDGCDTGACPVR
ncbi:ribonucleoside-triphosphate reductase, adenosylcobalamin-dependent [Fusibacter bizertensis]|uniref:Adenosylcobalamin-dependent ribonucleoside-triphosphate reductase n=1 Tax=Fusibacter bizertensis TaxID=1488331 RepID=A0ABT6NHI7_9FIRM|nr:ribonucleoside-triphosphate reductase, adenosylcobalamin-dependent [Fusibacter bizertensis]MDH8679896.1 ribonucleoside-triphosphate reductase, adenosylcobalamin-dependent [Fusibacter bizertensis]